MKYAEKQNNRRTGTNYEKAVGYYLEQQGYVILEYNTAAASERLI